MKNELGEVGLDVFFLFWLLCMTFLSESFCLVRYVVAFGKTALSELGFQAQLYS